jgi:hypothetical protein
MQPRGGTFLCATLDPARLSDLKIWTAAPRPSILDLSLIPDFTCWGGGHGRKALAKRANLQSSLKLDSWVFPYDPFTRPTLAEFVSGVGGPGCAIVSAVSTNPSNGGAGV